MMYVSSMSVCNYALAYLCWVSEILETVSYCLSCDLEAGISNVGEGMEQN